MLLFICIEIREFFRLGFLDEKGKGQVVLSGIRGIKKEGSYF